MTHQLVKNLAWFLKTSRPRFWGYLAGPWLIGYTAGAQTHLFYQEPLFWMGLIFFLWPANFLVYAINDWSDGDTDQFNTKKNTYETRFKSSFFPRFIGGLVFVALLSIIFAQSLSQESLIILLVWAFFSIGYSLPPIRFKARPWLDSWSNILYVLPGLVAYVMQTGLQNINWTIVIAATAWAAGMHLFSALPDIDADKKADVRTTAVAVGLAKSRGICCLYFTIASVLMIVSGYWLLGIIGGIIYVGTTLYLMLTDAQRDQIFTFYRFFPAINTAFGAFLFWYIIITTWIL